VSHLADRKRLFLGVTLLAIALIVALTAYFLLTTMQRVVPDTGGTYVEGTVGKPQYINPLLASSNVDADLCALIFSGLTQTDRSGAIVPDLAKSWEVSPDARVFTFHLRENTKWQDGTPVSADDVVTTIRLIQDPEFSGNPDLAAVWKTVSVEKVDNLTVRFTLKSPYVPFLNMTTLGLVPAHVLAGVPAKALPSHSFNLNPIGTGRFKLAKGGIGPDRIVLERNPDYYLARPYLDHVELRFFPTWEAALTALRKGMLHGIAYLPPEDLALVRSDERFSLLSKQYSGLTLLVFNLRRPPLDRQPVRQALALSLDRQRLIEGAVLGQGVLAEGPIAPNSWAFNPDLPRLRPDRALAERLLQGEGWQLQGGKWQREGKPLKLTVVTNDNAERERVAKLIADQWREFGIEADVKSFRLTKLLADHLSVHDFDVALLGWKGVNNDPDPYPLWHSTQVDSGLNFGGYRNVRVDQLLERARQTLSQEERKTSYYEFQAIFSQDIPAVPLYYPLYNFLVSRDVRGVSLGVLNEPSDRFRDISQWYMKTRTLYFGGGEATSVSAGGR
jgi:peptide/nickel transport system substrate-binding protein